MKKGLSFYWKLFSATFSLSAFTFGGGYIIIPLMRKKFVEQYHWIEEEEMMDLTAIAQSSPGAMAVNASILVGYRLAGIPGTLVTVLGTILPPLIILSIISIGYTAFRDSVAVSLVLRGMQAGVAAVIVDVVITMAKTICKGKRWIPIGIMIGASIFLRLCAQNQCRLDHPGMRGFWGAGGSVERKKEKGGDPMIYLELFWSFVQIGLFSIGGGYAALPIIQRQVVEVHPWLTMTEFADVLTISQMTPGPIAINSASFVGIRIAGIGGAIVATVGCVLPSLVIVLLLAFIYYRYRKLTVIQGILDGLRPAVVGLIASAGLSILILAFWNGNPVSFSLPDIDWIAVVLFAFCLFVLRKWKPNPIYVMAGAGILGLGAYYCLLI